MANQFSNDGSFLEQFRKLKKSPELQSNATDTAAGVTPSVPVTPVGSAGRRIGGITIGRMPKLSSSTSRPSAKATQPRKLISKHVPPVFGQDSSSDDEQTAINVNESCAKAAAFARKTAGVGRPSAVPSSAAVIGRRVDNETETAVSASVSSAPIQGQPAASARSSRWDIKAPPIVGDSVPSPPPENISRKERTDEPAKKKRTFREEPSQRTDYDDRNTSLSAKRPSLSVASSISVDQQSSSSDGKCTSAESDEDITKLQMQMRARMVAIKAIERLGSVVTQTNGTADGDPFLDGDVNSDGTAEHAKRYQEMLKTQENATKTTKAAGGKHHMFDFLPDSEKKAFMERLHAARSGKPMPSGSTSDQPKTDYHENRLQEDNKGFQLLQKMGWAHGTGLGATGQGITAPVNAGRAPGNSEGLGSIQADQITSEDDLYSAYRKQCMAAYKHRPNPLNNPRRKYY